MRAPAHRVLTLVRGLIAEGEAMRADDDTPGESVRVDDPLYADKLAAMAGRYGGEVG